MTRVAAPAYRLRTMGRNKAAWIGLLLAMGAIGCVPTSSAIRTSPNVYKRYEGAMGITALGVPVGSEQVGLVEAHRSGDINIEHVMPEFLERAAGIGADWALIDHIRHTYRWVTTTQTYTYSCGTSRYPRTCTGTRTVTREVPTVSIQGRAFRTPEAR